MSKTDIISLRVDHNLKEKTAKILDKLGMTTSQAVTMFLRQVEIYKGLPFDVKIPNSTTIAAMQEVEDMVSGKKARKPYSSFEELLDDATQD